MYKFNKNYYKCIPIMYLKLSYFKKNIHKTHASCWIPTKKNKKRNKRPIELRFFVTRETKLICTEVLFKLVHLLKKQNE